MKGIVLAGGTGTRLRPLTNLINKHLLPVGKYPMIHYSIQKLKNLGITDIILVTGKQSAKLYMKYLGSGEEHGVRMTYCMQEKPGGIAQALLLAEEHVQIGEKMLVLLGDNLFHDSLKEEVSYFKQSGDGALVMLKKVADPRRYGVPVFQKEDAKRIAYIEEKPVKPQSSYSVTGIYMYDDKVFDVIREIKPSGRGELEITDVNNVYARSGKLTYGELEGWWIDAGTHESLYEATRMIWEEEDTWRS
ncbi:sugar phosphate nucleotidyltransferase [Paenibacillus sp. N1-5-1-14]|uniref:sugar phosphate nucleotidyltransferase n=1 Tax=Paenibacillus radicibacter TaxID=2972488 RepID=UPI0021591D9D|nr:sugar phosphate nucleotidyltransferase [Paenibacillus radicibacter]MCR8645202.1 sugar phosphate nucleotidyltransferase [Paenibacillus radicibacter]